MSFEQLRKLARSGHTREIDKTKFKFKFRYNGVRVRRAERHKKKACSARVAEAGQENIETVHEPKHIQTTKSLCGQGRRAMKVLHGPQTRIHEGACAIKVSMTCSHDHRPAISFFEMRTDQAHHVDCCSQKK